MFNPTKCPMIGVSFLRLALFYAYPEKEFIQPDHFVGGCCSVSLK